jgi:hypothetical protein
MWNKVLSLILLNGTYMENNYEVFHIWSYKAMQWVKLYLTNAHRVFTNVSRLPSLEC